MSLLFEQGLRNEAIKLYLEFEKQLENDLDISPSNELEKLYFDIVSAE